jgi:excisionase family DNA binding protein
MTHNVKPRDGDELLDKRQAAQYLRVSVPWINNHLAAGLLIPTRVGGRVFFRKRTLDAFLRASERKARHEAAALRRQPKSEIKCEAGHAR